MASPTTPYLHVDLARMRRNVRAAAERASVAMVALRPHAKTHKCVEIARLQLAQGAAGLTVATIGEAEAFVRHGCEDVFVAYPLWLDDTAARRLRDLADRGTVAFGVDSPEAAANAGRLLGGSDVEVVVEVDSGMGRSVNASSRSISRRSSGVTALVRFGKSAGNSGRTTALARMANPFSILAGIVAPVGTLHETGVDTHATVPVPGHPLTSMLRRLKLPSAPLRKFPRLRVSRQRRG